MNVLELLNQELNQNPNWTLEQKHRHVYIRSCELFSYDYRYHFYHLCKNSFQLKNEMKLHKIDLENVEDSQVICTSHARVIYELEEKLLSSHPTICSASRIWNPKEESIESFINRVGHIWTTYSNDTTSIIADATNSSDLARVKMKLSTNGYSGIHIEEQLKSDDKAISYIQENYFNETLKERRYNVLSKPSKNSDFNGRNKPLIEHLYDLLYDIKDTFDSFHFPYFSDASFCISYLLLHYLEYPITAVPFFQIKDNGSWDFINLYSVPTDGIYFVLNQDKDDSHFYEITENDAIHYKESYQSSKKTNLSLF